MLPCLHVLYCWLLHRTAPGSIPSLRVWLGQFPWQTCPYSANSKRTEHLADVCIQPGGKMAGRSLEDAMAAQPCTSQLLLPYDEYVKPQFHWSAFHGKLLHNADNIFPLIFTTRGYLLDQSSSLRSALCGSCPVLSTAQQRRIAYPQPKELRVVGRHKSARPRKTI